MNSKHSKLKKKLYHHQHIDAQLLEPFFFFFKVIQKDSQWIPKDISISCYPHT